MAWKIFVFIDFKKIKWLSWLHLHISNCAHVFFYFLKTIPNVWHCSLLDLLSSTHFTSYEVVVPIFLLLLPLSPSSSLLSFTLQRTHLQSSTPSQKVSFSSPQTVTSLIYLISISWLSTFCVHLSVTFYSVKFLFLFMHFTFWVLFC